MDTYNKIPKSLGPKESQFITGLYEKGRQIFNLQTAKEVSGYSGQSLQNLLYKLVKKGVLSHLDTGLYQIVPFELGNTNEYLGNPYLVAREIVFNKEKSRKALYYISHASAMEIHQMLTQPQLIVYTTVSKQIKQSPQILGTEFRFITAKKDHFFGIKKHWADKSELLLISDIEKTILDGLKIPEYCGGITEVAKGMWIKRNEIDPEILLQYALLINKGVIFKRLGFLLETYKIAKESLLQKIESKISKNYLLLDPNLLNEGKYNARWKLRVNVPEEELKSVIRT